MSWTDFSPLRLFSAGFEPAKTIDDLVDHLRGKYAGVEFFPSRASGEELRKKQILDMVRILGFPLGRVKRARPSVYNSHM
jgi:hypothetical protein